MEVDRADLNHCSGKSISECFDEALRTFEEISNCDLATNSSEVQVRIYNIYYYLLQVMWGYDDVLFLLSP